MRYIFYACCIGFILMLLIIAGEALTKVLPETNSFSRWWRRNVIDKFPEDVN